MIIDEEINFRIVSKFNKVCDLDKDQGQVLSSVLYFEQLQIVFIRL